MKLFKSLLLVLILSLFHSASAQDVEPRRWSALPLNSSVIGAGYAYTFGDVLFDPLLEAEGVSIDINTLVASYAKPFKLANKLARIDVTIPYSFMQLNGTLSDEPASLYRNGFGDARLRFSINFSGPPPLNVVELQKYNKENPVNTIFGASIALTLPTGQYFDEKLINIGQNQIIVRPQIGMVRNWYSWSFELTGSIFLFTNNNNFFGGSTRKQDPIFALQTHLIKRFGPKIWTSLSLSYGLGGESTVNNISSADYRTNLLSAASVGYSLTRLQGLKLVYLKSDTLKDIGSNTDSIIVSWSYLFL